MEWFFLYSLLIIIILLLIDIHSELKKTERMKDKLAMLRYIDFIRMRNKGNPIQMPGDIGCFTKPNFYIKKTDKMDNYQLEQILTKTKNEIEKVIDYLIGNIEDLEQQLIEKDSLIESLKDRIQELEIENAELIEKSE